MGVLAIVIALLLEQWHPVADRKTWIAMLTQAANSLEAAFNAGEVRHGTIAWLVAVLPVVLGATALHYLLWWMHPLLALAFHVAVLYLTLGFRQSSHYFTGIQNAIRAGEMERAQELLGAWRGEPSGHRSREEVVRLTIEEALAHAHRHVFGVLFWYVVVPGPGGAILYRLAVFLERRWGLLGTFGQAAQRVRRALEWPVVRMTAAAFAVVGDFEDAIYCWRTQARAWPDPQLGIVLAAGAGALGVRLGMPLGEIAGPAARPDLGVGENAEPQFLDSTVGLLWRALVLWIFVLVVVSALRIF